MELTALITEIQNLTVAAREELIGFLRQDIERQAANADEAWYVEVLRQVNAIRNGEVAIREPHD